MRVYMMRNKSSWQCHLHKDSSAAAAAAKSLQLCLTLCDPRRQPTRLPHPWESPGKNTGVCCHFLLQCMQVKSESEVVQSCPTLSDPTDCSLPGSCVHGILQARVLEWGAIAFSKIMYTDKYNYFYVKGKKSGLERLNDMSQIYVLKLEVYPQFVRLQNLCF